MQQKSLITEDAIHLPKKKSTTRLQISSATMPVSLFTLQNESMNESQKISSPETITMFLESYTERKQNK